MYSISLVKDSHVSIKAKGGREVYTLESTTEDLTLDEAEFAVVEKSVRALIDIGILTLTDLREDEEPIMESKDEEASVEIEIGETLAMNIAEGLLSSEGLNYSAFVRILDASNPDQTFSKKHIQEVYIGILEILADSIYRQGHDWFKKHNHDDPETTGDTGVATEESDKGKTSDA